MSSETSTPRQRSGLMKLVAQVMPVLCVLALLGGAWYAIHHLTHRNPGDVAAEDSADEETAEASSAVVLPQNKIDAAGITTETVRDQSLQDVRVIAGRLRYNDTTHIDVKAPVSGVVVEMLVKTGDKVVRGQPLAIVDSREVGVARADVLKREAELNLAKRREDWQGEISENLRELLERMDGSEHTEEVEKEFAAKPLGTYRDTVLSSWLNMALAEQLTQQAESLAESGSLSRRTWLERDNTRRVTEAGFLGVKEQAGFESTQALEKAKIDVTDAERRVLISRQYLNTLLGYEEPIVQDSQSSPLSRMEIHAPFDATVEDRFVSKSERIELGQSLLILADTSTLYVAADIRERDWEDIRFQPGQEFVVKVPALPEMTFKAKALYMGREVQPVSNAVPMVAVIDNSAGLLRPGMFVRVEIPVGTARTAVAVPRRSVQQHENQQFVFVADNEQTFSRVDVETGQSTRDWVEVVSGVVPGQKVVANGAFQVKSELLLEGEEE